jgi:hypothetical protein
MRRSFVSFVDECEHWQTWNWAQVCNAHQHFIQTNHMANKMQRFVRCVGEADANDNEGLEVVEERQVRLL